MRVAVVAPSLKPASGWRALTIGAVTGLRDHAGVTPIVCVSTADAHDATLAFPGLEVVVLPHTQHLHLDRPGGWPATLETWTATRRQRLDVSIVHSLEAFPTGLVGQWLAARLGCPHVITAVGTYAVTWASTSFSRRAYRRVLASAAMILPISDGTASLMRKYFTDVLDAGRMRVVLLGSDAASRVARPANGATSNPDGPVVLSVGAIKPRKGYHVSVRAFGLVKQMVPTARYRIVGPVDQPDYLRELQQIVETEQVSDVEFLTTVSDAELDRQYRQASLFLLTPEQHGLAFEGFGLVYLEAGAYGLPVVATRTGGVADAVREGVTGLLADAGDVAGVARHVTALLGDPARARALGHANRDWSEHLTWERYAREQRHIYDDVVTAAHKS